VARVHAGARRARAPARAVPIGDALFEPASHAVVRHGRRFPLRPKEHALLCALLERRGQVVPRARLLAEVWGYAPDVATRTLDTHVRRLRRLLEHDPSRPRALVTVTALGYRLTADGGSPAALAS
jgi:DNA-binding response OmpR family regulator